VALDATRVGPGTRLECKVCWYVYDPAAGDPVWQIPPGTPFADLPSHWSCPNCSTEKTQFIVLEAEE
jgi:rubredoxin